MILNFTQRKPPAKTVWLLLIALCFVSNVALVQAIELEDILKEPPEATTAPQSHQQQRLQSSTTQQPQMQMPINPMQILGGLDLGSILGGLNSVGGVNGLFGLTLR